MDDRQTKPSGTFASLTQRQKKLVLAVWSYVGVLSAAIAVTILLIFRSPSYLLPVLVLFIGGGATGTCLAIWDSYLRTNS